MPEDSPTPPTLEPRARTGDILYSPSAARNRDAIRDAFFKHGPQAGKALEIGGGTGEHATHIAEAAPDLSWHTGDPDATSRASIAARIAESRLANLSGPHSIDVTERDWGVDEEAPYDAIISINMIHIAPFEAAQGLFAGAGRLLREGGVLFLYGPFSRKGAYTAPSNEAFDASLKARDARWGVRDLDHDIAPLAQKNALRLDAIVEMPANNLSVIFRKS